MGGRKEDGAFSVFSVQFRFRSRTSCSGTDYKDQATDKEYKESVDLFNIIADSKFNSGRIKKKPEARETLNNKLLLELYNENSR